LGEQKRGFAPILIIGGACPGGHTRVYAYEYIIRLSEETERRGERISET